MPTTPDEMPAMLPGLETPTQPVGALVAAVDEQIAQLRKLGYIEDHHNAQVELARVAARDIDNSLGRGAPSGRANLLRVMNEILEGLPQPEAASKDQLDDVVQAMRDHADDDWDEVIHDVRTSSPVPDAPRS